MRGIILPFIFICLALGCKDREAVGETAVIDSAGIKYHKLKADTAELRKIGTEWEYIFERDQALRVKYGALFTEGKMDKKDEQRVIDSMNKNDSLSRSKILIRISFSQSSTLVLLKRFLSSPNISYVIS